MKMTFQPKKRQRSKVHFLYTFLTVAHADIGVAELSIDVAVSGK